MASRLSASAPMLLPSASIAPFIATRSEPRAPPDTTGKPAATVLRATSLAKASAAASMLREPITATQVVLQMVHRMAAVTILVLVAACFWRLRARGGDPVLRRLSLTWLILVVAQACLGAWTVWSNKAADIATLHVVGGALSLAVGSLICIIAVRFNFRCCGTGQNLA